MAGVVDIWHPGPPSMSLAAAILALLAPPVPAQEPGEVDFRRDVEPVLAAACHECHGPTRHAAGLRLDQRAAALAGSFLGRQPVIEPGDAEASELLYRVETDDPDERMPPEGAGLSEAQRATLRRWVEQGAPWPDDGEEARWPAKHWSFQRPRRPQPPAVGDPAWVREPLDRFVLARLEEAGLAPAPEADRRTLIRRLSLDLTGLPPTPEEIAAFLADPAPDAYERLVDRLLASPHYGERMARGWLDLARYADTDGYEKDNDRTAWPYRDWVVHAFNEDLPFDRFTLEQLAGDLLPDAGVDQLVATGFHRNTMVNQEGGTDPEEFRVEAVKDRVDTTATVWMGLTMACAQCHNHKYDPVSQREYYEMFAVFNQTEDTGNLQTPVVEAPPAGLRPVLEEGRARIAALEQRLATITPELGREMRAWEDGLRARLALEEAAAPRWSPWEYAGPFPAPADQTVYTAPGPPETAPEEVHWAARPEWEDGRVHTFADQTAPAAHYLRRTVEVSAAADWTWTFGSDDSIRVFLDGTEVLGREVARGAAVDQDRLELELAPGRHELLVKIGNTGGVTGFAFRVLPAGLTPAQATLLRVPWTERTPLDQKPLDDLFLANTPSLAPVREELEAARAGLPAVPTAMVMRERAEPRPTHLLEKGNFLLPGEPVGPGLPAVLTAAVPAEIEDRADLARWLTDPDHPLTARVAANRIWQHHFGRGLVATPENFGTQGDLPSHPQLLDWLATEYVRLGWSTKAMHRMIVCSATYRQASATTAAKTAADPENRLLSRGPRFRLGGEELRDLSLAAAGLLEPALGGPSVFPPQPAGYDNGTYAGDRWRTSEGPDRYRRSLYTFWRRTSPYPVYQLFDAPSREVCVTRRVRSNTPLQALSQFNEQTAVEAAAGLARRMAEAGDDAAGLDLGHELCTARLPRPEEAELLLGLLAEERARFAAEPQQLEALRASSHGLLDGVTAADAAWFLVANVLLNLDETLTLG